MARRVLWAPKARQDLFAHLDYMAADSYEAAELVNERIMARMKSLSDHATGRAGRVFGTYESYVPKTSLVICYELPDGASLAILRLIHAKRNWPAGKWPSDAV